MPYRPPAGLEYHRLHRGGRQGWGWALLGVLLTGVLVTTIGPAVVHVAFMSAYVIRHQGGDAGAFLDRVADGPLTPIGLAVLSLSLASSVVAVMFVTRVIHGLHPGWLASVCRRIRWRWMLACVGLSVVTLAVTVAVSSLLPAGDEPVAGLNDFTQMTRDFLIVILLLTPLQAIGEEYAFRGYLTQAVGGLLPPPWVARVAAVVVPALIFAIAHGAQQPVVFFDRFAFGIVAGVLVIVTGGLEAGIAMHILNNLLAFGMALAFGDIATSLDPTTSDWWPVVVTLVRSLVFLALVLWLARGWGIATRTSARTGSDWSSQAAHM